MSSKKKATPTQQKKKQNECRLLYLLKEKGRLRSSEIGRESMAEFGRRLYGGVLSKMLKRMLEDGRIEIHETPPERSQKHSVIRFAITDAGLDWFSQQEVDLSDTSLDGPFGGPKGGIWRQPVGSS